MNPTFIPKHREFVRDETQHYTIKEDIRQMACVLGLIYNTKYKTGLSYDKLVSLKSIRKSWSFPATSEKNERIDFKAHQLRHLINVLFDYCDGDGDSIPTSDFLNHRIITIFSFD